MIVIVIITWDSPRTVVVIKLRRTSALDLKQQQKHIRCLLCWSKTTAEAYSLVLVPSYKRKYLVINFELESITSYLLACTLISAALSPRLLGTKVPGHTTRAPPVEFELATNCIQCHRQLGQDIPDHQCAADKKVSITFTQQTAFIKQIDFPSETVRHDIPSFLWRTKHSRVSEGSYIHLAWTGKMMQSCIVI